MWYYYVASSAAQQRWWPVSEYWVVMDVYLIRITGVDSRPLRDRHIFYTSSLPHAVTPPLQDPHLAPFPYTPFYLYTSIYLPISMLSIWLYIDKYNPCLDPLLNSLRQDRFHLDIKRQQFAGGQDITHQLLEASWYVLFYFTIIQKVVTSGNNKGPARYLVLALRAS